MKTKHTPGPWHYYTSPQPNGCPIIGDDRGLMVAMLSHSVNESDDAHRREALANARLIAAAPELLEALELLLNNVGKNSDYPGTNAARAAIAKATTEAP